MFRHVVEAGKHHFHVMTSIPCSYYHILGGTPHPAIVTVRDDGVKAFLHSNYIIISIIPVFRNLPTSILMV